MNETTKGYGMQFVNGLLFGAGFGLALVLIKLVGLHVV